MDLHETRETKTEEHLREAQRLMLHEGSDEIERAITEINRAIFLSPLDMRLFPVRAEAFSQLHDVDSAINDLRYVVARDSKADAKVRHRLAALLAMKGQWWLERAHNGDERALECFTEAAKLDPLCAEYWIHCALAKTKAGDLHGALESISRAIKIEPGMATGRGPQETAEQYILRAKLFWALGLADAGINDMKTAQTFDPNHVEVLSFNETTLKTTAALYRKATTQMCRQSYKDAINTLTSAIKLAPDDCKLTITRGAAHRLAGDLDAALADLKTASVAYREATKPVGNNPSLSRPKLPSRQSQDDISTPDALMYEPFQLVRQRNLVLNDLALHSIERGEYEHALSLLNRVISAEQALVARGDCDTVDRRFLVNRGDCYHYLGKIDCSTADFRTAFEADPNDWSVRTRLSVSHYNFATTLFNEGDFRQAEVEFSIAIELNDKVARYYAGRGIAAYHRQKFDAVADDFREAIRLDPTLHDIRMRLQQFESQSRGLESYSKGHIEVPPVLPSEENGHPLQQSRSRPGDRRDAQRARGPHLFQKQEPPFAKQIPRGFRAVYNQSRAPKVDSKSRSASLPRPSGHLNEAILSSRRAHKKVGALRDRVLCGKETQLWSVLQPRKFDHCQRTT